MNRKSILDNAAAEAKKLLPENSAENPAWKKTRADLIFAFQNSTDDVFLSAVKNYVATAGKLGEENFGRELPAVAVAPRSNHSNTQADPASKLIDQPGSNPDQPDPLSQFARPCPTCSLPIIWFSIYDRLPPPGQPLPPGATPAPTPKPHCPECSPPPSPALVDGMYHVVGVANAGLGAGLPTFADPTTLTAGRLTLQKFWPREGDVRDARPTATTTSPTTHPKITVTKSDRSAGSPGGGGEGKNREAATTKTLF